MELLDQIFNENENKYTKELTDKNKDHFLYFRNSSNHTQPMVHLLKSFYFNSFGLLSFVPRVRNFLVLGVGPTIVLLSQFTDVSGTTVV